MIFASAYRSIGFAKCSFISVVLAACTSSAKALTDYTITSLFAFTLTAL